jgi:replicative DNA helicase
MLDEIYFYSDRHKRIYAEVAQQFREIGEIDGVSIAMHLRADMNYILDLIKVDSVAIVRDAVFVMKENYCDREVDIAYKKSKEEQNGLDKLIAIKDRCEELETEIQRGIKTDDSHSDFVRGLDDESAVVPPSIGQLQRNGLVYEYGTSIVIAARPSVGKTALACHEACYLAFNCGLPVDFYTFEMHAPYIRRRMVANRTGIKIDTIRLRQFSLLQKERCIAASKEIEEANIDIFYFGGRDINELVTAIKTSKSRIVFIDYLQKVQVRGATKPRDRVSEAISKITDIARRDKKIVFTLSQLNRDAQDKRPTLSELAESSVIEQEADTIIFIHEENAMKNKEDRKEIVPTWLLVDKQKDGENPFANVGHNKAMSKFFEFDTIHTQQTF